MGGQAAVGEGGKAPFGPPIATALKELNSKHGNDIF